jgi:hypothetical protein
MGNRKGERKWVEELGGKKGGLAVAKADENVMQSRQAMTHTHALPNLKWYRILLIGLRSWHVREYALDYIGWGIDIRQ